MDLAAMLTPTTATAAPQVKVQPKYTNVSQWSLAKIRKRVCVRL